MNISSETVYNKSGYLVLSGFRKTFQGSDNLCKDTSLVDIRYQDNRCTCMFCHSKIDDVMGGQVDFGTGTRAFHHDKFVFIS